ncbi:MAG: hypothetical protein Q8M15_02135 [Bacteroidota bacterium]|nr:hypothetical protein [Bacteroidota bacterium]
MKIKSKALYEYLLKAGVLNSSPEEITIAKKEYRKSYRNVWMKNKSKLSRELRIVYTLREYRDLKVYAKSIGTSPTALCKTLTTSVMQNKNVIPNKEQLNELLQGISMTLNIAFKMKANLQLIEELQEVETKLLNYLKNN